MTVSVVMATFNGEAFVEAQVRSILDNTTQPDDLIIVDDHSTDGTLRITERLIEENGSVAITLVKNSKNRGATPAFLEGVALSPSDVVFFSDQDDIWMPDKIHRLVEVFERNPKTLMVYCDGEITDRDLAPTGRTIFSTRHRTDLKKGGTRPVTDIAANPDIKGCTMAVRGDFVRTLVQQSDPSFSRYWGHDHWIALFAYGLGKVEAIDRPLILHRFHGANASSGTKFNPLRPADWLKWKRAAVKEDVDHASKRYRLAIDQAEKYGDAFSAELKLALNVMLDISMRREALRALPILKRFLEARKLHRAGLYKRYFNGVFTLMRDTFL